MFLNHFFIFTVARTKANPIMIFRLSCLGCFFDSSS